MTSYLLGGFMIYIISVVGHGRSDGERAQINNFDVFSRDVIYHIMDIHSKYQDIPIFLYGHSMVCLYFFSFR